MASNNGDGINPVEKLVKEQKKKVKKKLKASEELREKQESRLNKLQSKGFQLANYYFVFQGVILTTLCNGRTVLKCSDRWLLPTLSALAAAVNLAPLISIGVKYIRIFKQQEITQSNCDSLLQKKGNLEKYLKQIPSSGDVVQQVQNQKSGQAVEVDTWEIRKRWFYFGICMFFFLSFPVIVLVSSLKFLCRDTQHPKCN
jgi:ribosome-associated translation inhibitor RaiA